MTTDADGLNSRTASQRGKADGGNPPTPTTLPPRKQAFKALTKHAVGALRHGAASVLHATTAKMDRTIAAHSRPMSDLANAYDLSAQMTKPLARNEAATAKLHFKAMQAAAKAVMKKASTFDAGTTAQRLSELKTQKQDLRADRKEVLSLGVEPQPAASPAGPSRAGATVGPDALMAHTDKPAAATGRAALATLRHAAAGLGHKGKQGMHSIGALARSHAPALAQAHQKAKASHRHEAALSFAEAGSHAGHTRHYAHVAARPVLEKASAALKNIQAKFAKTPPPNPAQPGEQAIASKPEQLAHAEGAR